MSSRPAASAVTLVVGNTYERLPDSVAKMDRSGSHLKVHDWTLHVDVVEGNPDLIQSVKFDLGSTFKPRAFTCRSPTNIVLPDGSRATRFKTRQQSFGSVVAYVSVNGRGGAPYRKKHTVALRKNGSHSPPVRYSIPQPTRPLELVAVPDKKFGIELELTSTGGVPREMVAQTIRSRAHVRVTVVEGYAQAHDPVEGWKLVHDGSILCSRDFPDCTKFELVSPVLQGRSGLDEVRNVLASLAGISSDVNKSMGFHVHVNVEDYCLASLKKFCQNFIKYEECMDTFMPTSRRTGSPESNQYFQSNKSAVIGPNASNLDRHKALAGCSTLRQLCEMMNPTGRYYKLNMQNLVTGSKPTVEFRQHSATSNYKKVNAWVRFCLAMVNNSAKFVAPKALKSTRTTNEQFDFLFQYVIKDRVICDFYKERRAELQNQRNSSSASGSTCCHGCANERGCQAKRRARYVD
mmetsp:Transcript_36235/g.73985  ORF Transcript_36235/g.73985 Transcript_36235/m.73985 type:complete len:462 (-) Transcript_36235:145-1530(-)